MNKSELVDNMEQGVELALNVIADGSAGAKLKALVEMSQSLARP